MAGNYRYLDFEDRKKIEAWHARGDRPLEIAARLGVHTATIYHELQRGYFEQYEGVWPNELYETQAGAAAECRRRNALPCGYVEKAVNYLEE